MDRENHIRFLSGIPFFAEVSKASLQHFCQDLEPEKFHKGETVFDKGSAGDAMYVILTGEVNIHENQHVYCILSSGDCFGEYALIDNKPRSASVTALRETKVLKIPKEHFLNLMQKDAGFAQGVLSVMIKRHRELDVIQESLAAAKKEVDVVNSKMSGLINGAMDAIVMFGSDFRILLTNASAHKLFENEDVLKRNLLFFMDENSAELLTSTITSKVKEPTFNCLLPEVIKLIGSDEKETLLEATLSKYTDDNVAHFILILRNIEERIKAEKTIQTLTKQTQYLEEEINELTNKYGIVAGDKAMKKVLGQVNKVAPTDATVLITGETGTGKELIARAIHQAGTRKDKPLIRINCGAIPTNLIESELFGHEKGAFTGATSDRKGRFSLAHGGTIFLDEIGELPLELQPKLLRVIQEGEFDPVGSSKTVKVDVRIIAATHRDLPTLSSEGKFREDLYYRLNVFPVHVPPLRDRGADVLAIAAEMLIHFSKKLSKPEFKLTANDEETLMSYHWPGNVRELQNLIERAVIISDSGGVNWKSIIPAHDQVGDEKTMPEEHIVLTNDQFVDLERQNILKALKKTRWKISGKNGAASLLKLPPTTLASKIKALGIVRPV